MQTHTSKVSLMKSVGVSWWMANSARTPGGHPKGPVVQRDDASRVPEQAMSPCLVQSASRWKKTPTTTEAQGRQGLRANRDLWGAALHRLVCMA